MKIKGIASILLIALVACQTETKTPEFKDAEAVFLNLEKTYILHPDGSVERQIKKSQKLLTHRAFHSLYGQTDIYYNPESDSVLVDLAETQTPDGTLVPVPENGYVDMIPGFATGSEAFSHLRHKAVVHTALEIGSVIHANYRIITKAGHLPALMGLEVVNQDCPIIHYKLVVQVPKDYSINFNTIHIDGDPVIKKRGKNKLYIWEMENVDQNSAEPFSPRFNSSKKQILFSSADSLFPVFNEFTSQRAFTFETTVEMRERVNKSLEGQTDTFDKIAAIQKMVTEEIQTIPVPLNLLGYQIRPAAETWASMAGTPEEKAVLLCALIRSTGWKATPVATIPKYLVSRDSSLNLIGNLDLIGFNLVRFPVAGINYYISPDRFELQNASSHYPGHYFVPLEMGYSKVNLDLDLVPDEEYQVSWDGTLKLESNLHLKGRFDANFIGPANPYLGLKMRPESIKTIYSGKGTMEQVRPKSSVVSFEADLADAVTEFGSKLQIQLPFFEKGFGSWGLNYLAPKRAGVLELPHPIREFQRMVIQVPANYEPVDLLIDISFQNEVGRVTIRHTYVNGKISAMRNLLIENTTIPVGQYSQLKELIDTWVNPNYKRVILEK